MSYNEEKIKDKILEKDKLTLIYKQKLNKVKQHYGIDFDVEHLKTNEVKEIIFVNLKYKNTFENLTLIYNLETKKYDFMSYEFMDVRHVKKVNHKKISSIVERDYKLKTLINEIQKINYEYKNDIFQLERNYSKAPTPNSNQEKVLFLNETENED